MINQKPAIVGIDPKTRRVEIVAVNNRDNQHEIADAGLIMVPTTMEAARVMWGEVVDDIFERFCK
jgi:Holliday junction resolvasome RuvABC endonuclease subunit